MALLTYKYPEIHLYAYKEGLDFFYKRTMGGMENEKSRKMGGKKEKTLSSA